MAASNLKVEGIIAFIAKLNKQQLRDLAFTCVDRLIECQEVGFRDFDPDPEHGHPADIFWYGNGESLVEKSE
jgi:hypothetical protein